MINRVIIAGRLTKDPELRVLPSGSKVVELSLAYNRSYKVNNEWKEEAHYFDVRTYGALADRLSTQVSKGYMVLVEGRLSQERWTSKDGKNMSKISIIADSVKLINKPQGGAGAKEESYYPEEEVSGLEDIKADIEKTISDEDDDVPF